MPQRTDGPTGPGFTKTPNAALFDKRLSLQDRAVYSMLLHLVWLHRPDRRAGGVLGEPVQLPPQTELALTMGVSVPVLKQRLANLRALGYVETSRPNRHEPLYYTIRGELGEFDADPEILVGEVVQDPTGEGLQAPSYARGILAGRTLEDGTSEDETLSARADVGDGEVDWSTVGKPPELPRDDRGHVEAIDALQIICGIDSASRQRMKEIAVALHGTRNVNDQPGINRLFWLECARGFGTSLDVIRDRAAANPTGYQSLLVAAIQRRAAQYQQRLRGAELTPGALAKWWLDLERGPGGSDRPLTPDEIERL